MKSRLLLLLLLISSCSVKQKELSFVKSEYIIDLDGKKEAPVPLSTYFKSAKTIILETGKDYFIGLINEFQVFDECVYILDMIYAKGMYVFDMDGRFIRKIGSVGNGPGEYIQLMDFTIDTENRFIFLLDFGKRIHKYHLDGAFVQTITPKISNTSIESIQFYKNKLFLSVLAWKATTDDLMLLETDPDDGTIISSSIPLKYNKGWGKSFSTGHSFFMSRVNTPPLYTQLFMDYIVTVEEEITPYIELKSKNLVTGEDLRNLPDVSTGPLGGVMALRNLPKIWDIYSYVENHDIILFKYMYGSDANNAVIFDKNTETVKIVEILVNDLIYKKDRKFGKFVFHNTKGAYEILQTKDIDSFQESIRNNETVSELDKKDELLRLNEESNPVIFYYEFK